MILKIVLVAFILTFGSLSSRCDEANRTFGMLELKYPNGEKVYFRREARGLNFDSLTLSRDPNHCRVPDNTSDIIFKGLGPIHLFYPFEGDNLHLYLTNPVTIPPVLKNLNIIQHGLTNQQYLAFSKNHKSEGLEFLDIPLDERLKNCERPRWIEAGVRPAILRYCFF